MSDITGVAATIWRATTGSLTCHARRTSVSALVGAALVCAGAVGAGVVAPAAAHPFGEPQQVELSAEGSTVTVRWSAPPDDLILLGGVVGALPDRREIVFNTSPSAPPEPVGETDADRLVASDAVATYLQEHVSVRQNGTECPVDVHLDGLVDTGAELVFDCFDDIKDVEVGVSMLTDIHEAYRTVAIGDGTTSPDRSLYTIDDDVHVWTFGAGAGEGPSMASVAGWGAFGLVLVAACALAVRRLTRQDVR